MLTIYNESENPWYTTEVESMPMVILRKEKTVEGSGTRRTRMRRISVLMNYIDEEGLNTLLDKKNMMPSLSNVATELVLPYMHSVNKHYFAFKDFSTVLTNSGANNPGNYYLLSFNIKDKMLVGSSNFDILEYYANGDELSMIAFCKAGQKISLTFIDKKTAYNVIKKTEYSFEDNTMTVYTKESSGNREDYKMLPLQRFRPRVLTHGVMIHEDAKESFDFICERNLNGPHKTFETVIFNDSDGSFIDAAQDIRNRGYKAITVFADKGWFDESSKELTDEIKTVFTVILAAEYQYNERLKRPAYKVQPIKL